jgi:tetratricopeptide (TPR) repeat protein
MLEAALAADPENVFNWRHLAQVLTGLGRHQEAERALERAVELARVIHNEHGSAAWGDLVRLRHERGEDVRELVAEGRARWPANWSLVWAEGQAHLAAGRCGDAIACFGALLEVDAASLPAHGVAYDERLFGSFAYAAIGLALFRAGRYAEAAAAYAAAERSEPGAAEHRVKRQLAESRSRRAAEQATAAAS